MKQRFSSTYQADQALISRVSSALRQLRDEMVICYPNRENVTEQLIHAIVMREHLLMWGRTGTAKSALTTAAFSAFPDATLFRTNLNKFSTEAHVVGVPDPNVARDEGRIYYRPQGMILPAHFVFLDEFLDASEPLLRTLLNILNERTFDRGEQHEKANLMTAVATTNANPYNLMKAVSSLEAVIDRFMFICKVIDLADENDQMAMLNSYLSGLAPSVSISLADITAFSGIVINYNLLTNPVLISAYLSVFNAFEKETGEDLSDRTLAKMTQILEASALLDGRTEIYPNDLRAIRWGICDGDNTDQQAIADRLIEIEIKKAEKSYANGTDVAQLQLINTYVKDFPAAPIDGSDPVALMAMAQKLTVMEAGLKQMTCQLTTTEESRQKLLRSIDKRRKQIEKLVFGVK